MPRQSRRGHRKPRSGGGFKQPPWHRISNPYAPIEVLGEEQLERIHEASLEVLETIGMEFLSSEALDILDAAGADAAYAALEAGRPEQAFDGKELALLRYAGKLTAAVGAMEQADIEALRGAGADDGEILEVNQVCAYFNYSNRLLNGLGISTTGDTIGYYD